MHAWRKDGKEATWAGRGFWGGGVWWCRVVVVVRSVAGGRGGVAALDGGHARLGVLHCVLQLRWRAGCSCCSAWGRASAPCTCCGMQAGVMGRKGRGMEGQEVGARGVVRRGIVVVVVKGRCWCGGR